MKKFLIIVLLTVIAVGVHAQSVSENSITEERVVECNLSKDKLWANLKKWIAKEFVSYKHTVDMEDRESGTIILKFNLYDKLGAGAFVDLIINATLHVDVKDHKYRYSISNASYGFKPNSICDNLQFSSSSFLEKAKLNLECADNLSNRTEIPSGLNFYEKYYKSKLESTPKYKKPKDEKKGKINPDYTEIDETLKIIGMIRTKFSLMTYNISSSLERIMDENNANW